MTKRFNIVVLNYKRLESFFNNFQKISNFEKSIDSITILSCSPSIEESLMIEQFEKRESIKLQYIVRRNFGHAEAARAEYFSGLLSNNVYDSEYLFQFQEHYLDTESEFSKWGKELNFKIKGDVIPDNVIFDLNEIYNILKKNKISGAFCDRNNPCWFKFSKNTFIAPNGGNFIIRTSVLKNEEIQREIRKMLTNCDNTYPWAVYAEYKWGVLFFKEGNNYFDIKRHKIYNVFPKDEFYISPDKVKPLFNRYERDVKFRKQLYKIRQFFNVFKST